MECLLRVAFKNLRKYGCTVFLLMMVEGWTLRIACTFCRLPSEESVWVLQCSRNVDIFAHLVVMSSLAMMGYRGQVVYIYCIVIGSPGVFVSKQTP